MNQINKYLTLAFLLLLAACEESTDKAPISAIPEPDQNEGLIEVTNEQFEMAKMALGQLDSIAFSSTIRTNGYIDVPPKSKSAISVYYGGYVKDLDLLPGQKVNKGQVLFTLENPDFVQMQQDYLEAKEQLSYLKMDYERQQTLAAENIASQKNYLKAESDYKVQQARSEGLKKKLQLLGISIDQVESMVFTTSVKVRAPISGFITKIGTGSGSFLNTSDVALEITNRDHLHLELDVFEKDLAQLRKGQTIKYRVPGSGMEVYTAEVHLIGGVIEGANRVVRVHGHLEDEGEQHPFIPGMYIEAEIETQSRMALALPEEAVVRMNEDAFILLQTDHSTDGYVFEKKQIQAGRVDNGMIEVLEIDKIDRNIPILTKGAFFLIADEDGEGHSH